MTEFTTPKLEGIEIENILRWEDDGGKILDVGGPMDWSNPYMTEELAKE